MAIRVVITPTWDTLLWGSSSLPHPPVAPHQSPRYDYPIIITILIIIFEAAYTTCCGLCYYNWFWNAVFFRWLSECVSGHVVSVNGKYAHVPVTLWLFILCVTYQVAEAPSITILQNKQLLFVCDLFLFVVIWYHLECIWGCWYSFTYLVDHKNV